MNKKLKIGLIGVGTIFTALTVAYIVRKHNFNKVMKQIQGASNQNIDDFVAYFNGQSYLSAIAGSYIKLADSYVTDYRTKLYNAISGIGTDEDTVLDIFNRLRDGVQIAQISKSYTDHYGENLLDALKGDLSDDDMKKVSRIISVKPKFRLA